MKLRPDLDRDETLFAEANAMLGAPTAEIRAAFLHAVPGTSAHARYVAHREEQSKRYQGTSPFGYRTDANGDYTIMTVQLAKGDWVATTREFKAFAATEGAAVRKLGQFMVEAGDSIRKLAGPIEDAASSIKHPTDPPHCRTCGEYGCTKHKEASIEP